MDFLSLHMAIIISLHECVGSFCSFCESKYLSFSEDGTVISEQRLNRTRSYN